VSDTAIEAIGLGKRYRLGQQQAAYGSLRDSIASAVRPRRRGAAHPKEVWAVRNVDLAVKEGEALGLVGTNGAGKSTLLRIIARITDPTEGLTRTRGRVGVMLEVGTGFHPELTGRENVFLGGAVMGMTRRDIRARFDEIVEFAGVAPFLETPLKRYSSGMQLRLAFAVAAHLEPELMLVDEILAVGDVEFQRRCMNRMDRLSHEGRTVVFVSHDMGAVARLCTRAVWVDHGTVVRDDSPTAVIQEYYAKLLSHAGQAEFDVRGDVGVSHVAIVDEHGSVLPQPPRDEPFYLQARLVAGQPVGGLDMCVYIQQRDGTQLIQENWKDQPGMPELVPAAGEYAVRVKIPPVLPAGDYMVGVWVGTDHTCYFDQQVLSLTLVPSPTDRQEWLVRRRTLQPPVGWSAQRVESAEVLA
jgi:ABC-2 type transport system ATP-binding protein/lipopolysaccharide transport system ATP-binding protein